MEETGLKGYRTTIAFCLLLVLTFVSLWLGFFTAENTITLVSTTFLGYVGAKASYKVAEVVKERVNAKKGQNSSDSGPPV